MRNTCEKMEDGLENDAMALKPVKQRDPKHDSLGETTFFVVVLAFATRKATIDTIR